MRSLIRLVGLVPFCLLAACQLSVGDGSGATPSTSEATDTTAIAGANANDRSAGKDGEAIQTGAMITSPSGNYIVMQRNQLTLIYNVTTRRYTEANFVSERVGFSPNSDVVYVFYVMNGAPTLGAIDLASGNPIWTSPLRQIPTMLRVSPDGAHLALADKQGAFFVDTARGAISAKVATVGAVANSTWLPGANRALLVAPTVWRDKKPHTPVYLADATSGLVTTLDIPNCEAPIAVTPDGARAFLSPTYCVPGAQAVPGEVWTNPDPVSVIDLGGKDGAAFLKNLPGFGPVAIDPQGKRVVAYLDIQRIDPAMFDDAKQVPWSKGQRYHIMTIDPQTLKFALAPIGNAIPRFAMTRDGRGLLVDASAAVTTRATLAVRAQATIGLDGVTTSVESNVDLFGLKSTFGYFDLATQSFSSFSGPFAPLDRFVQFADGKTVLSLATRADGLGGTPYLIDLEKKQVVQLNGAYGTGVRDVGLSASGNLGYLRLRLAADHRDGAFYSREGLCASSNGACRVELDGSFEASSPFGYDPPPPPPDQPVVPYTPACPTNHDC